MCRRMLTLVWLLLPLSVHAQELSLQDALHTAMGSPRIEKAEALTEEASWRRVEALSGFLPTLSGGVSYLSNHKYAVQDIVLPGAGAAITIPQIVPTTTYSLNAQWSLFDGFSSWDRLEASQLGESAAKKEFSWTQFQTERDVILQFYRALAAKVLKDVAIENVKTLEDHLRDVQLFRKSGVGTNYDVLRVEVQVSAAKSEVLNASDNVDISRGHLAEMLGLDETREIKGELPVLNAEMISGLKETSVEGRKDLIALKERTQSFEKQEKAAGRYWVPRIAAFGSYQYYNNEDDSYNEWKKFRDAYQVGLSLSWNFFDGMVSIAHSNQAMQERVQAEKTMRMTSLHAHQDFQVWKRKFNYYCHVYRSRLDDIEKSREAVRLAKAGRRAGVRTNTDLLDAETDLHHSMADAVNAQIGSIEALINLELASGTPLYNFN